MAVLLTGLDKKTVSVFVPVILWNSSGGGGIWGNQLKCIMGHRFWVRLNGYFFEEFVLDIYFCNLYMTYTILSNCAALPHI